jgi:molybdenum cofactor synthesis domain-containing protein
MSEVINRTAALLVIGNEILSGKVVDTNTPYLAKELRALGVALQRILTIPDDIDEIAAAIREMQPRYDHVFTSGGVGPTHDDVTIEGIAKGLGRRVVRNSFVADRIREYQKDRTTEASLRMADFPEGVELLMDARLGFPTIKVENIFILPGIPQIFEAKFAAIRDRFAATPFTLRVIYTCHHEGQIAEHLNATVAAYPELLLGSYPKIGDPDYAVKLTLESKDPDYVARAAAHLIGLLPAGAVVRTE